MSAVSAMSEHIIAGACMKCDTMCFEVIARHDESGLPKQIGGPLDGATRVGFLLMDGSRADVTVCGECAGTLGPQDYAELWRKIIRSWLREIKDQRPDWFIKQFANGLLCELGRVSWKELR